MCFLKSLSCFFLALSLSLGGCSTKYEINPVLLKIEKKLIEDPGNALFTLENLHLEGSFNDIDIAFYYILLAEARSQNGISLSESDALIDFSIKTLNDKFYPALLARAYLSKGRVQNELEEPHKAMEMFYEGIKLLEKKDLTSVVLSKLYDEVGTILLYGFVYEEAIDAFRKGFEIDRKLGDIRKITFSLHNIGTAFHFMEETDSAFFYYNEALRYAKQSEDSTNLCDSIHNEIPTLQYHKQHLSITDSTHVKNEHCEIKFINYKQKSEITSDHIRKIYGRLFSTIISVFIIISLSTLIFFFYRDRKQRMETKKMMMDLTSLREKIISSDNEISVLKIREKHNILLIQKKTIERKEFLDSLFQMEINHFRKRKINRKIIKVKTIPTMIDKLTVKDINKLHLDIQETFIETIKQLKRSNPNITKEQILIVCLRKLNLTFKEIGLLLNYNETTIRRKIDKIS